jgi:citrate synthase
MLEEIHRNGGDVDKYMAAFKDKNDPFCRVLSQSLQEF